MPKSDLLQLLDEMIADWRNAAGRSGDSDQRSHFNSGAAALMYFKEKIQKKMEMNN